MKFNRIKINSYHYSIEKKNKSKLKLTKMINETKPIRKGIQKGRTTLGGKVTL